MCGRHRACAPGAARTRLMSLAGTLAVTAPCRSWLPIGLSPLTGLVVAGGLAGDDVKPVPGVDLGDERNQRG
jgi:hypothetical protein